MMREIKFRVWDTKRKSWTSPWSISEYTPIVDIRDAIYDGDNLIIEQFTGLKDKNGAEIYEGDIVHWESGTFNGAIGEISWGYHWEYAGFGITGKRQEPRFEKDSPRYWDSLNPKYAEISEVIGNIHCNPELLTTLTE